MKRQPMMRRDGFVQDDRSRRPNKVEVYESDPPVFLRGSGASSLGVELFPPQACPLCRHPVLALQCRSGPRFCCKCPSRRGD